MAKHREGFSTKEEMRHQLELAEGMVARFAERIRAFQAVHTMRVEETGLFIGMLAVLYREWLDKNNGQDGPSRHFVRWVETRSAEDLVSILVGLPSLYSSVSCSSGVAGGCDHCDE